MQFNIYPINLLKALSLALELSADGLSRHHWRTSMIAYKLAEYIGLKKTEQLDVLYSSFIHDIGAASNWEEKQRIRLLGQEGIHVHAEDGYKLLVDSDQLKNLALPVRHHHDSWDGKGNPSGLSGQEIPLFSRIINLADRVEVLIRDSKCIIEQGAEILSVINKQSGKMFDPILVEALNELGRKDSFWLDLVNEHYYYNFFKGLDVFGQMPFTLRDIGSISEIFATIVDRTSKFTGRHSRSVAVVSAYLGRVMGWNDDQTEVLRIAGLLHDLGKLAVPNAILEKPGSLTEREFAVIKRHSYYTYRVLEQIDGFECIARWAGYHHETIDGRGYPFGVAGESLDLGSRIVAAADVFTALTESRPYREPLGLPKVQNIMFEMANSQKLDRMVVGELFANGQEIYDQIQQCE